MDLSADERRITKSLYELVQHGGQVRLLGSTRQEVLSGIREESTFQRIRGHMRDFPNVPLDAGDYEEADRASNQCRRAGITGSPVDLLMCVVALRHGWQIFTTDRDFGNYSSVLNVKLFSIA
jgi:predicted nucleic acid-binding protein